MSHVSLQPVTFARWLLVTLAALSVVWLAQAATGPLSREEALAAPSAPLPRPAAVPTPAAHPVFLPHITQKRDTVTRFQVVASPNFGLEVVRLMAVDLLNDHDGWAVGGYDWVNASLTLHWDGANWTHVPSPSPESNPNSQWLGDVIAIAPNDAWASVDDYVSYLLHWDGQAWTVVPLDPDLGQTLIYGLAATGPTDVWAVGGIREPPPSYRILTRMLHWDGRAWKSVASPNPGPYDNRLAAIAARLPNDIWVVGEMFHGLWDDRQPFMLHWDGQNWQSVPLPSVQANDYVLSSVTALAADDAWAVGLYRRSPSWLLHPVSLHWDGRSWQLVPLPSAGQMSAMLTDVVAVAPDRVVAMGSLSDSIHYPVPWLLRWNGAAWSVVNDLPPHSEGQYLFALDAVAPDTIVGVGQYRIRSEVDGWQMHSLPWSLHWDGATWRQPGHPELLIPRNQINGIAAASPTDLWAVGAYYDADGSDYDASLLHWDGWAWTRVVPPDFSRGHDTLASVAAVSGTDVWAVGGQDSHQKPLLTHWDGARWQTVTLSDTRGFLHRIAARAGNDVWAVGYYETGASDRPLILHWDGHDWTSRPAPPLNTDDTILLDVEPITRDNVWAVGYAVDLPGYLNQPLILHWQEGQWTRVPTPSYAPAEAYLACVTALAPDDIWAMGRRTYEGTTQALALHWDGHAWTTAPHPAPNVIYSRLSDCLAVSPTEVYAVGSLQPVVGSPTETLVVRWEGAGWTRIDSANPGSRSNALSALTVAGETLWAVGDSAQADWRPDTGATLIERAYRGGYPPR